MDSFTGKIELLRDRIDRNRARGLPMPAYQVLWLASEYAELPGSLKPDGERVSGSFETLQPAQKLARLLAELHAAQSLDAHVPTPWAEWLLGELDKLLAALANGRERLPA